MILPLFVSLVFISTTSVSAYVGPGAAVALVGTVFGFGAAIAVSIFFVLAWPAWKLYVWYKARNQPKD